MWQEQVSIRKLRVPNLLQNKASRCSVQERCQVQRKRKKHGQSWRKDIWSRGTNVTDATAVANRATRTLSAEFNDSKCSTFGRSGHLRAVCESAGETQRVQSGNIPEPSQDEADV